MKNTSRRKYPNLEVSASPIHGKGLFSKDRIERGGAILKMDGLVIKKSDFHDDIYCRYSTVSVSDSEFLTRLLADAKTLDDFINHSCSPNSWLADEYTVISKVQIEPGQEITIDYAVWLDHPEYQPLGPCACGSASCRTWITGQDWRRMDVVRSNYGHFMPYLNTRVDKELDSISVLRK